MLTASAAKKIGKIFAITMAILLALLLIFVVSTVLVLQSPKAQSWFLAKLEKPLAEAGIRWSYQEFSIDLLDHIQFQDLRLELAAPMPAEGLIELSKFKLHYSLSGITSRHLDIHELTVAGLRGDLVLKLAESQEEEEEQDQAAAKLFDPRELFDTPPATLKLERLHLDDIHLNIQLAGPSMTGNLTLNDLDIQAAFELAKGNLSGNWSAAIPMQFDIKLQSAEQSLQSSGRLSLDHRGQIQAEGDSRQWQQELNLEQSTIKLADFKLAQQSGMGKQDIQLKNFQLNNSLHLEKPSAPLPKQAGLSLYLPLLGRMQGDILLQDLVIIVQKEEGQQQIKLPELSSNWAFHPQIASLQSAEDIQGDGQFQLSLAQLTINEDKKQLLMLPQLLLQADMNSDGRQPAGNLKLRLQDLRIEAVKKALQIEQDMQWAVQPSPSHIGLKSQLQLNQMPLLKLQLAVHSLEQDTSIELNTEVQIPEKLKSLHDGAAILAGLGDLNLTAKQSLQFANKQAIWKEDFSDLENLSLEHLLTLNLRQKPPRGKALVRFAGFNIELGSKLHQGSLVSKLALAGQKIQHEALQKPVDLQQNLELDIMLRPPLSAKLEAFTQLAAQQILQLKARLLDESRVLKLDYQLQAEVPPKLSEYLPALEILKQLGSIQLSLNQDAAIHHKAESIRELDMSQPDYRHQIKSELKGQLALQPKSASEDLLLRLDKELGLSSKLSIEGFSLHNQTKIDIPQITVPDTIRLEQISILSEAQINHLESLQRIDTELDFSLKKASVLMEIPDREHINRLLQDITAKLQAQLREQKLLNIKTLNFAMAPPFIAFQAKGNGSASGSAEFQGALKVQLPGELGPQTQLEGGIEVPVSISLFDQNNISVMLQPSFQRVSLSYPPIQLDQLDGSMTIREELKLRDNGSIDFLFYEDHNPFARVDYDTVEPMLADRQLLGFEGAKLDHIQLGPMVSNIEIRQNMILLNDLRLNLLGGSALGRMYLNLNPANPQIGFLGRFTQLDPRLLLTAEQRSTVGQSGVISGRSALVFDIRKRLATGRIDITSIGREQLLRFIDLIDPNFEDPQLGAARKALYLAYPRKLTIDMDQGMMDLEIQLGGVLSNTITVRSLPLTPLIIANADEALSQIEKILSDTGDEQ